jgi:leucyl-tRNA synthetase
MAPVDWCPNDGVLAREQVIGPDRLCWRDGAPVVKKDLEQWFFRQTKYADELLTYDVISWPEPIKVQQTNWIGRSEGAEVVFTPRNPLAARAAKRSACLRHGPTRSLARHSWSWRPSTRWWKH